MRKRRVVRQPYRVCACGLCLVCCKREREQPQEPNWRWSGRRRQGLGEYYRRDERTPAGLGSTLQRLGFVRRFTLAQTYRPLRDEQGGVIG